MAVKASGANVNLRLRGTAGDGETDINEEINGESTDANANVSLATLSTGVGFNTTDGGHKMSEFFGYSSYTPTFNTSNFTINTYAGNNSTQSIEGKIGTAASFNGSSSKVDLPNLGISGAATRTISAWVNVNSLSSNQTIFQFGNSAAVQRFGFAIDTSGKVYVEYYGRDAITSSAYITVGTWFHVVATYNGGVIQTPTNTQIYINSSAVSMSTTGSSTGLASTTDSNYGIGYRRASSTQYFNGKIDQVRIFNKALSSSEVTTLYNENNTSTTISTTDIFGDGSGVALYEFENGAKDSGRFGNGAIDTGQSAVFNGSSYIATNPQTQQQGFSWSFWLNYTSTSLYSFIASVYTGSDVSGVPNALFVNSQNNGALALALGNNGSYVFNFNHTTTGLNDGQWHQVVVSWDGTTAANAVKFYIDNVVTTATSSISAASLPNYSEFALGARAVDHIVKYTGKIDQVRIYSSALSASDVKALVTETNVPTANLVAHYKLDGDATDETTNYNGAWGGTQAYSTPAEFPAYNGTATNVSFVGTSFQPDLVWIKGRNAALSHVIHDVQNQPHLLITNGTNALITNGSNTVTFTSNGFNLQGGGNHTSVNGSYNFVAWAWKAGGPAVNNTDGVTSGSVTAVTSTVSANQDAGFSINKFTTPSSGFPSWGHGLSEPPELIILKATGLTQNWIVYAPSILGQKDGILNSTAAFSSYSPDIISVDSSKIDLGRSGYGLSGSSDYIAYCFHSVVGYQKVGSYSGDGTSNASNIQNIGFRPRFLLIKSSNIANNWEIFDSTRDSLNPNNKILRPNLSNAETTYTYGINFLDNGFVPENAWFNGASENFIYLAIA